MAHIVRDSFDFYGAIAEASGLWDSTGTAALSANTRFGAGQSFSLPTTLNQVGPSKIFSGNSSTVFLTFALGYYNALSASLNSQEFRFYDGATVQCSIVFSQDGTVNFYRGDASVLVAGPFACFSGSAAGSWTHLQFKIVFSGTVGEFHMRRNGNSADDASATGLNNIITANAYANKIDTKCLQSASNVVYLDDLWVYDSSIVAGDPSDFIGDVRAIQIMPTSDSSVQFTRSTGATNFSCVDELINSTADYVSSSTASQVDQYGNSGFSVTPASIIGLAVRGIMQKTDAGTRTAGIRINSGGTQADSAGVAIGTNYQSVVMNQNVDPNTSAAWSSAAVAAMLFGPRVVT
jgi:hypothetical protein